MNSPDRPPSPEQDPHQAPPGNTMPLADAPLTRVDKQVIYAAPSAGTGPIDPPFTRERPPRQNPAPEPMPLENLPPIGPKEPFESPRTGQIIHSLQPTSRVSFHWNGLDVQMQYNHPDTTKQESIGGVGITRRPLEQLDSQVPTLREQLEAETGKIVFLGNGLSTAPLELLEQRESVEADPPEIVIVDAFNYEELHTDLQGLKTAFDANLVEAPMGLEEALTNCTALVEGAAANRIKIVQHVIGDDPLPDEAKNADIAVNVFGPPHETIGAQLECLKPGGKLYIGSSVPPRAPGPVTRLATGGSTLGYVVTKES